MPNKMKILVVAAAILGATAAVEVTPAAAASHILLPRGGMGAHFGHANGARFAHTSGMGGQWMGRGGNWQRGGNGWIGPAIGFGAGVAIGSALAAPYYGAPYAYGPAYAYDDSSSSCAARFRSYNPVTHTYTGYDGLQHPCA
jgi:hypothetical protein